MSIVNRGATKPKRRLAVRLVAILAALGLAVPVADAAVKSTVKIHSISGEIRPGVDHYSVTGTLDARKDECVKRRLVRVFVTRSSGATEPVGRDRASRGGFWSLFFDQEGGDAVGDYHAEVREETRGGVRCRADVSPVFEVR